MRAERLLLLAKFISLVGDAITMMALPLLVYEKTGSATTLALTVSIELSLYTITSLFAGAITDKMSTKKICIFLDVFRALLLIGGIYLLKYNFRVDFAIGLSAILTILSAIYSAGFDSIPHILFSKGEQNSVVAHFQSLNQMALLSGSAIAGTIVTAIGSMNAIFLDVATFMISALILNLIQIPARTIEVGLGDLLKKPALLFEDIRLGFVFVLQNNFVRSTLLLALALNIIAGTKEALWLPILTYAKISPANIGFINSVLMAAFIATSLVCARIISPSIKSWGRWLLIAQALTFSAGVIMAFGNSNFISHYVLGAIFLHVAMAIHSFASTVSRRSLIPPQFAGRSLTAARVVSRLASPIGMFCATSLVASQPFQYIFAIMAGAFLCLSIAPCRQIFRESGQE